MRVMVIGASRKQEKYGNRAVRAYLRQGHEVVAVHPTAEAIEGAPAYPNVADVPGRVDRATLYLPPAKGMDVLAPLAARGDVRELWVNPGAESPELIAEAKRLGLEPIQACSIMDIGEAPWAAHPWHGGGAALRVKKKRPRTGVRGLSGFAGQGVRDVVRVTVRPWRRRGRRGHWR